MNIQATLNQLNANTAQRFNTHGLTADTLRWLDAEKFAAVDDSRYGKGLLVKFTAGKLVVFPEIAVMSPELQAELGLSRYIPPMDITTFMVILTELADIHREGWVEAKTLAALSTVFNEAVAVRDRQATIQAESRTNSTIVGMRLKEVQHKHFKDGVWTVGAYGLLAVALVTASILDARTEA